MGKIVTKNAVNRKAGMLYYVDGKGNVCEAPMKRKKKATAKKKPAARKKAVAKKKPATRKKAAPRKKTATKRRKTARK